MITHGNFEIYRNFELIIQFVVCTCVVYLVLVSVTTFCFILQYRFLIIECLSCSYLERHFREQIWGHTRIQESLYQ